MHALLCQFMEVTDYESKLDVLLRSFANAYLLFGFEDCIEYTISLYELANFP